MTATHHDQPPAPSADSQAATGAASVTAPVSPIAGEIERAALRHEVAEMLFGLMLAELEQVAHVIERIKERKAA